MKRSLILSLVCLSISNPVFASDSDSDDEKFFRRSSDRKSLFESDFFKRGFDTPFFKGQRDSTLSSSSRKKTTTVTYNDGNSRMTFTTEADSNIDADISDRIALIDQRKYLLNLIESMLHWQQDTQEKKLAGLGNLKKQVELFADTILLFEKRKHLFKPATREIFDAHVKAFEGLKKDYPILFGKTNVSVREQQDLVEEKLIEMFCNSQILEQAVNNHDYSEFLNYAQHIQNGLDQLLRNPFVIALKAGKLSDVHKDEELRNQVIMQKILAVESLAAILKEGQDKAIKLMDLAKTSSVTSPSQATPESITTAKLPADPESMRSFLEKIISSFQAIKTQSEQYLDRTGPLSADVIREQEIQKKSNVRLIANLNILFSAFEELLHGFNYNDKAHRDDLFGFYYDGKRQFEKLKKKYPYLLQTKEEILEHLEQVQIKTVSELMDGLKASVTVYQSGDPEFMAECLSHICTFGEKLLDNPYVQRILASTDNWEIAKDPFHQAVLKVVMDVNNILRKEKSASSADDKGKDESLTRPPLVSRPQRSNSMNGIRVTAIDEGMFAVDDCLASKKTTFTDAELLQKIGLNFQFYKPSRNLVVSLCSIDEYAKMLGKCLSEKTEKRKIEAVYKNAFQEKEFFLNHPYKEIRYKNKFETEQYHPARDEEMQLRRKSDFLLDCLQYRLEVIEGYLASK